MNAQLLMDTAPAMVESDPTCNKRCAWLGRIFRDCWLWDIAGPSRLIGSPQEGSKGKVS